MDEETRYYKIFKGEELPLKRGIYETIINLIPSALRAGTDFGLGKTFDPILEQAQINVKTGDVVTLAIYVFLLGIVLDLAFMMLTPFSSFLLISMLGLTLFITAAVFGYPYLQAQRVKMLIVGQSPLAILYMVISLRVTPTLENALAFAAKNVPDPVGQELKRILWQVQIRTYSSVAEALYKYSSSIKDWAPGFSDSIYLLANSVEQPSSEERLKTLEKAIQISLENTETIMEKFARNLALPVMATNALGVILPVLGLVMAPITAIFTNVTNMSVILTMVYCVILPLILLGIIAAILSTRPGSFSYIDVSLHPEAKEVGKINIAGMKIDGWLVGLLVFLFFSSPTFLILITQGPKMFAPTMEPTDSLKTIPLIFGIAVGAGVWLISGNSKKTQIANEIRGIEREFSSSLYQLSNIMQQGMPLEEAIKEASYALKGTRSAAFFQRAIENIEELGYPPELAFFDANVGAVRLFPSSMIKNVLGILLNAAKRSTVATASAAQSISIYLQNLQKVDAKVEDLLSESISTMKFQSYALIPLISGVVVGLSQMITQILIKVTEQIQTAFQGSSMGVYGTSIMGGLINMKGTVPPSYLQLVVGFYTLEVLLLSGLFSGGLEKGTEDDTGIKAEIGKLMGIGGVIYVMVSALVTIFFSGLLIAVLK